MTEAAWRQRFRAPVALLPHWSPLRPDRLLYLSNASGKWEFSAWDRSAHVHRQVTDRREGTTNAQIGPSGEEVYWFSDTDGDELGVWMVQPFDAGEPRIAFDGISPAYSAGLALGTAAAAVASSDDEGSRIYVAQADAGPRLIYQHAEAAWLSGVPRWWASISGLSGDGRYLCLHHSEHGDSRHPAVRVGDLAGATVAELWDGPGLGLSAAAWSPAAGDPRIIVHHERDGARRPLIWAPERKETVDLPMDLPGEVEASWYPDGKALLLEHDHGGQVELLMYDIADGAITSLRIAPGSAAPAAVRPDGDVWFVWTDAATSFEVRNADGGRVLSPPGDPAPPGAPYLSLTAGSVPAFVAQPPGLGPHPTIMLIHGGPDAHDADYFSPLVQAWVDHGFACALVNYRGSTGYGRDWRDAITGNPGFTELEDIAAVREMVIAEGIADPSRLLLAGISWGGYLTLVGLGTQPELWSLGIAGVPVADYVAAYEDGMEPLKAYDRALFGGASPSDDPELYRERSPITYVERVKVPVLVFVGENDPRCPARQIDNYLARLTALGKPHEVVRFDAGHTSKKIDEQIRQTEQMIDFAARHLGHGLATLMRIGLIGWGTMGAALGELIATGPLPIALVRVAVRDTARARSRGLPPGVDIGPSQELVEDAGLDAVVELAGGIEEPARWARTTLQSGRPYITGNKALLATHGAELASLAKANSAALLASASVGGATPMIELVEHLAASSRIVRLRGLLNATTTYILAAMGTGSSYDDALGEAQRAGYAEPDPSFDVEGRDAAQKLAILASVAWSRWRAEREVETHGIVGVDVPKGATIRLVAEADETMMRVAPIEVAQGTPLAAASGVEGVLEVELRDGAILRISGPGAGGPASVGAVYADLARLVAGERPILLGASVAS